MSTTDTTSIDEFLDQLLEKPAAPAPEEETSEETDLEKLKQRKPPKDGPCKACGQDKPLNRLFLCYPCWVRAELEKRGWKPGEPHPSWCQCEGLPGHARKSFGN